MYWVLQNLLSCSRPVNSNPNDSLKPSPIKAIIANKQLSYFPQLVTHLSTYNLIYYLVNHGSTVIRTQHYKFKYWFNDDGSLGFKIVQFKIDFIQNLKKIEQTNKKLFSTRKKEYSGDQTDDPSTDKDIYNNQPPQNLPKPETSNCEQTMPIISLVHCYQLGNQENNSNTNKEQQIQQHSSKVIKEDITNSNETLVQQYRSDIKSSVKEIRDHIDYTTLVLPQQKTLIPTPVVQTLITDEN
ncbi:hypothetical protein ACTFIU_002681 [Dictyostelium citrinum]